MNCGDLQASALQPPAGPTVGAHAPLGLRGGENLLLYGAFYINLFERHQGLRPEPWDCLVDVTTDR